MSLVACGADWDRVRQAVSSAYFTNAARMKGIGEYENLRTGVHVAVEPQLRVVCCATMWMCCSSQAAVDFPVPLPSCCVACLAPYARQERRMRAKSAKALLSRAIS